MPKVIHPNFDRVIERGDDGRPIVCFTFGRVVKPDKEALDAMKRIGEALCDVSQVDLAEIKKWHGNLVLYGMNARYENPEITDAEMDECKAATVAAFPACVVVGAWRNMNGGLIGVSVKIDRLPK